MKLLLATFLGLGAGLSSGAIVNIIGDSATTASSVGAASSLGNGDYQLSTGTGGIPYSAMPNWFHPAGAESVNHGNTGGVAGSNPQAGASNIGAFQFNGRLNINDSGYTPVTGDVFSFATYWHPNGGGAAGTDTLTVGLYTSSATVDGDVVLGDLSLVDSVVLAVGNTEGFYTAGDFYTADGTEGELFLGLTLSATNSTFSRTDLVSLSVDTIPEPAAATLLGMGLIGFCARRRRG